MSCHSCSRLLARLGTSTVLALLLWVTALEPPLAYALPSTTATPPPATGWYSLRPLFTGLEPQSPVHTSRLGQLLQRLPILLAQATSGYDAGTATAGGLLNTFRLPTEQHLQSVPNYNPAELERQEGNPYYRQTPSRPDSPDPLRDDAAAATDPTLQLVQERATRPPWSIDLKSIDAMQGGQVDIPENGCGLFEYCVTEGAVDRTEECTVHYTYEEATCHEYYSHDVECQTERANGAKAQCTDDRFIYELTRDPDTSEWLFLALDIGPEGWAHKNCWDGPPQPYCYYDDSLGTICYTPPADPTFFGQYHIIARLPANETPPTLQIHAQGPGCNVADDTLSVPDTPMVGHLSCGANGAQVPTVTWEAIWQSCQTVPHFHDECTPYKTTPWFEKSHQCLTPAPGFNNDCDDLLRTYGKYTEISSTCQPWIDMGCGQTGETCKTDDCTTATRTFSCREQGCVQYQQAVLCGTCVPDPPNAPRCITTDTPANPDFGMATAVMEGQVTSEQNRDNTGIEIYAFPGFAQSCKSNPLINCCNQSGAQDTANNIQKGIQAMQMAMNAYKAYEAFSTLYTATTVMTEVYGYSMVEATQLVATEMMSEYIAGMFAFSWLGVFMIAVVAISMLMQFLMSCDEGSTETAVKKDMGLCVDVGEYCSQKILFACWGHRHASCCFSNLIARIIQQQGRAQLGIGWGDPKAPDCRGLSVEELQAIDWERIDFSEYIAQLQQRITVPTADSVQHRGTDLMAATDFLGQAHTTLDQYASLESRVTRDLTVPGTDPPASVPASAHLTMGITGQGTITLSPGDTACGRGTCPVQLAANQAFSATATPADGWGFRSWSGACSGTGTCLFTLTHEAWLNATFTQMSMPFSIRVVGPGSVTTTPSSAPCTADCTPSFAPGTVVTLSAVPASGATFLGWGGACVGTGSCTVTVQSVQGITADFAYVPEITSFAPTSPGTLTVGVPMTWTVGVSGGTPPVEYQFTRDDNGMPLVVQDFSTNGAYTWVPGATDVGTHRLQVAVRNAGSSSPGDDFAITEYFQVAP